MTKSFQITLTITAVKIETRKPFGPTYRWESGERDEMFLNVQAEDQYGRTVFFNSPAIERRISSCPGAAVVTFFGSGKNYDESDWMTIPEGYCVTANQKSGGQSVEPKLAAGEVITIKAQLKKEYGAESYSLKNVRR